MRWRSFRERSNFPQIWFRDLRFRTWGLEINHLNAHNFVCHGYFFLSLLSRKFDDRLSSNFHRFVILCICWDTPTVKTSLWQLPIVSTVFKIKDKYEVNRKLTYIKRFNNIHISRYKFDTLETTDLHVDIKTHSNGNIKNTIQR